MVPAAKEGGGGTCRKGGIGVIPAARDRLEVIPAARDRLEVIPAEKEG